MEPSILLLLSFSAFLLTDQSAGMVLEKVEVSAEMEKLKNDDQGKSEIQEPNTKLSATAEELAVQKAEMENLKKENEGLKSRLDAMEKEIENVKQKNDQTAPRVAFSTSLSNSGEINRGPSTDRTLVFKRIFTNIGSGYNEATGVFTAPVSGLYYFTFNSYGYNSHTTGALLLKNGVVKISTYEYPSEDTADSSGNAVILQLAMGDTVHMELWEDGRVFDNMNGHTTFSGFLLFPL